MFGLFKKRSQPKPLRLMAQSAEDVVPIAALTQDAALRGVGLHYDPKARHFMLRMNRFCHEQGGSQPLRAPCVLQIHSVLKVRSRGIDLKRRVQALSVLTMEAMPREDGAYELLLTFAGPQGNQLCLEVECLDILLMDLAAPHRAQSKPEHNIED